jgi:hypothetical protein
MVDKRMKKGELNEGLKNYLLKEVREKMRDIGWENLSDDEKNYRKRIWDMYIEYGDRMERDELNENRCNRLYLSYGMYGVDFRIMNCMDGIEGEKIIGGNGYDLVGLIEDSDSDNFDRNYEIENRIVWGFIMGCCRSVGVERVYDSENGEWENWSDYEKVMVKYLNDDLENYY